ncbi:MAG: hypothetical protein A4E55_00248 [Pelotomaculum sp. PtaU1.Bin035]|nr:MAG: hypothetical protein A4E55_00248 [Pelotomaculum sp. PtaU1.Bin035]
MALLEQILKIEPNNQEALQLKSDYSYALQEEKKSINTINSKQALQIVVNYSGSPNWDVFEGTLDEKFLVNGTSQYTNGHPSCFFVGKGGNVAIYVVDKIDGSLYGSRKEIINGEFIYYLTKLK